MRERAGGWKEKQGELGTSSLLKMTSSFVQGDHDVTVASTGHQLSPVHKWMFAV